MRYPNSWVKAMDRPGGEKGETLALVGNFKDIDTVSIRREPLDMHEDFVSAAAGYSSDTDGAAGKGDVLSVHTNAPFVLFKSLNSRLFLLSTFVSISHDQ